LDVYVLQSGYQMIDHGRPQLQELPPLELFVGHGLFLLCLYNDSVPDKAPSDCLGLNLVLIKIWDFRHVHELIHHNGETSPEIKYLRSTIRSRKF
jgi:hypothetical protein